MTLTLVCMLIDAYWEVPAFFFWMIGLFPGVSLRFMVFRQASFKRKAATLAAIVAFVFLVLGLWVAFEAEFIPNMDTETAWTFAAYLSAWTLAPSLATYAILRHDANRLYETPT